jgi:hypothetical protein
VLASDVTAHIMTTYESGRLITMCGWCRRVQIDGGWALAPRAALTAIDAEFTISHSICPECVTATESPSHDL